MEKVIPDNTIFLPPFAPALINSTRAIGYSIESAVADIIDNSIAAKAKNIKLFYSPDDEYISIIDDGIGMGYDAINIAMQYGSKNPAEIRSQDDLGRFGLGLKTASLSQCRKLTVVSKIGNHYEGRCWDIDFVAEQGQWYLKVLSRSEIDKLPDIDELDENDSGTIVVWQCLDRMQNGQIDIYQAMTNKMSQTKRHLALVFHRYLEGEKGIQKINILFNNQKIEPNNPFLPTKSSQTMDDEQLFYNVGDKKAIVVVKPYILPHPSVLSQQEIDKLGGDEDLRKNQGFYIYRNKRLLVWGTWFRMIRKGELSKLSRVQVDIPNTLDEFWSLDIKKSSAMPPENVKKDLEKIIKRNADEGKRVWTFRGKKETSRELQHTWNRLETRTGGILYEVNKEHILIKDILAKAPHIKNELFSFLKLLHETLPVNSLYQDLTCDYKIDNDCIFDFDTIVEHADKLIETCINDIEKRKMLSALIETRPFNRYKEDLFEHYLGSDM